MGESLNFTTPELAFPNPPIILSSEDLPQPDGPVIVTNSFLKACIDTSTGTGRSSFSFLKSRLTWSTVMMASEKERDLSSGSVFSIIEPLDFTDDKLSAHFCSIFLTVVGEPSRRVVINSAPDCQIECH